MSKNVNAYFNYSVLKSSEPCEITAFKNNNDNLYSHNTDS